jgi:hypothetical protein
VVIGLIAEYRHEVAEFWEEVRRPAAVFPWQKFWAIAGGVLVTVGVAGELIVGIKASRKEGDLRTINHQSENLLREKASKNEKDAAQLRKDAERLRKDARAEGIRVEQLREANNAADAKLEAEKTKRVRLAASLLPRRFWDQSGTIQKLAALNTKLTVVFEFIDDREATSAAQQIAMVFDLLRWKYMRRHVPETVIRDGITISPGAKPPAASERNTIPARMQEWIKQGRIARAASGALAKGLTNSGIEATVESGYDDERFGPDTIVIRIGSKPNPVLEDALEELGEPKSTAIAGSFIHTSGNRVSIPDEDTVEPSKKP